MAVINRTNVNGIANVNDALAASGLNWTVAQFPIMAVPPVEFGNAIAIPDGQANIRINSDGTTSYLGTVGHMTHVLQNADAFSVFQPLIDSGKISLDHFGHFYNGGLVYGQAFLTEAEVRPGDFHKAFMMVANAHDGSGSSKVGQTYDRVICMNTYKAAIKGKQMFTVNHSKDVKSKYLEMAEIVTAQIMGFQEHIELLKTLDKKSIKSVDIKSLVANILGLKGKLTDAARGKIEKIVEFSFSGIGNKGESLYDVFNGITQYLTHESGRKEETRLESMLFGRNGEIGQEALDILLAA